MIEDILRNYEPISLEDMSGIRLMNRTDTKFVTTLGRLEALLAEAGEEYYAQEIDGRRLASYYTLYFDTGECAMFRAHHNGKLNRQKLRIRSYVDSNLDFLEVKTKNNHGRTKKKRVALGEGFDHSHCLSLGEAVGEPEDYRDFLSQYLRYDPSAMEGKIENRFRRITLVNKGKTERLTIDTGIKFHNIREDSDLELEGLVIIELKRDGLIPSPILEMLRRMRIKPMGFSKYCMGMVMTDNGIMTNRFRPRLTKIDKIIHSR